MGAYAGCTVPPFEARIDPIGATGAALPDCLVFLDMLPTYVARTYVVGEDAGHDMAAGGCCQHSCTGRQGVLRRRLRLQELLEHLLWYRWGPLARIQRRRGRHYYSLVGWRMIVPPARHRKASARFLERY